MVRPNNPYILQPELQDQHWNSTRYRRPESPVVEAYIRPKLDFIDSYVDFRNKRVVDVGCGNGLIASYLKKDYHAQVFGIDINEWMLRHNDSGLSARGDSHYLPFHDDAFEVGIEANLLHHVIDPVPVIREMKRVSRTHIIFIEPNVYNPIMFAFSCLVKAERGGLRSSIKNLKTWAEQAGLMVVADQTTGMISQNNTPQILVPFLKFFDRNFCLGEYHVLVCRVMDQG